MPKEIGRESESELRAVFEEMLAEYNQASHSNRLFETSLELFIPSADENACMDCPTVAQTWSVKIGDLAHEHVVEEADLNNDDEVIFSCMSDTDQKCMDPPHACRGVLFRRCRESVVLHTAVVAGDCGSGKTTFLRTLAGGAVGILQVLRYHTSHFTNLWFDVSPQTLRTFLAANPFARGRKNDNVAQTPSRLLPLFPTELSTCTLAMDLQELAFFSQ